MAHSLSCLWYLLHLGILGLLQGTSHVDYPDPSLLSGSPSGLFVTLQPRTLGLKMVVVVWGGGGAKEIDPVSPLAHQCNTTKYLFTCRTKRELNLFQNLVLICTLILFPRKQIRFKTCLGYVVAIISARNPSTKFALA